MIPTVHSNTTLKIKDHSRIHVPDEAVGKHVKRFVEELGSDVELKNGVLAFCKSIAPPAVRIHILIVPVLI